MESRGPLAASPGLLLLLPLPPHGHQRIQDPPAVHLSSGSGQEPITIMTFDFTKIRKYEAMPHVPSFLLRPSRTSSSFELRTWDPEGVIFYGDTNPQKDCFVLGLRDGRPEIQMRNHLAQLTVGAGPRLDDGKWHQVEVKVLGDSLLLSVDGEEVLCLRQVSGPLAGKVQPVVRIALGGLLFPVSSLRLPPQKLRCRVPAWHILPSGDSSRIQSPSLMQSPGPSLWTWDSSWQQVLATSLPLGPQKTLLGSASSSKIKRGFFGLLLLGWPLGTRPEVGHGPGPEQKSEHLDSQLSPEPRQ
ncbi:sex hormone-binding globulin isoform X4 [Lynx canadensis]|uniref:sex hormone-binding globulin isoform X4 n=1 Tax=Lynx canadensis TaxID=61383 RepID=UPI0011B05593|nr:sex hormone-binding globulin isoform X4 [Lynx canadensis]